MSYTSPVAFMAGNYNTGSLVAPEPAYCMQQTYLQLEQQTHAVFDELAHYGSEPFNYYVPLVLLKTGVPIPEL